MPIIKSAKGAVYHQPQSGLSSDTSPIPMDFSISQKHPSNFVKFVTFAPGILFCSVRGDRGEDGWKDAKH